LTGAYSAVSDLAAEPLGQARFAVADELTCYYDRPAEPANVHLEARVPVRLDEAALRAAVRAVFEAEPELRARQSATSKLRPAFYWDYQAEIGVDPVLTASYADETELAGLRSALLSQSPSLRTSPPVRFLLATGPAGDNLILNAHHACFDGLSSLRLFRLVADRYSAHVGAAPDRPSLAPPGGSAGSGGAPDMAFPSRVRPGPIAKIARQPEPGPPAAREGYGTEHLVWDGLASAGTLRSRGVSVNDLLIAALITTIGDWNAARGRAQGTIKITMPVGDRSQAGAAGRWANTSRLTSVSARIGPDVAATDLLLDVAAQTRYAKEHEGPQVDLFCRLLAAAPVPVAVKAGVLRAAILLAGSVVCDTCLVSNLGVAPPIAFAGATATQLWFSTSAHMPRGLSLGAVTVAGRLHLTFRYRRALLAGSAAAQFASSYADVLDQITAQEATP
jgi:NRPS condensation-like uncharacterized protein